jgi:hypothetical protein
MAEFAAQPPLAGGKIGYERALIVTKVTGREVFAGASGDGYVYMDAGAVGDTVRICVDGVVSVKTVTAVETGDIVYTDPNTGNVTVSQPSVGSLPLGVSLMNGSANSFIYIKI